MACLLCESEAAKTGDTGMLTLHIGVQCAPPAPVTPISGGFKPPGLSRGGSASGVSESSVRSQFPLSAASARQASESSQGTSKPSAARSVFDANKVQQTMPVYRTVLISDDQRSISNFIVQRPSVQLTFERNRETSSLGNPKDNRDNDTSDSEEDEDASDNEFGRSRSRSRGRDRSKSPPGKVYRLTWPIIGKVSLIASQSPDTSKEVEFSPQRVVSVRVEDSHETEDDDLSTAGEAGAADDAPPGSQQSLIGLALSRGAGRDNRRDFLFILFPSPGTTYDFFSDVEKHWPLKFKATVVLATPGAWACFPAERLVSKVLMAPLPSKPNSHLSDADRTRLKKSSRTPLPEGVTFTSLYFLGKKDAEELEHMTGGWEATRNKINAHYLAQGLHVILDPRPGTEASDDEPGSFGEGERLAKTICTKCGTYIKLRKTLKGEVRGGSTTSIVRHVNKTCTGRWTQSQYEQRLTQEHEAAAQELLKPGV
jgi:hypothetical protein